jgi:hypothetical protein
MPKRIPYSELGGKRPVRRPRRRWTDAVNECCKEIFCYKELEDKSDE